MTLSGGAHRTVGLAVSAAVARAVGARVGGRAGRVLRERVERGSRGDGRRVQVVAWVAGVQRALRPRRADGSVAVAAGKRGVDGSVAGGDG